MPQRKVKAIAMISGGLDSTLAMALIQQQGIPIKAINFYTGFCITETQRRLGRTRPDGSPPPNDALEAAARLGVEVEMIDISGRKYLDVITHPRWGYGANANPCVDCRVFMMSMAREVMEREGADFVLTGEVLGQRPKSQRRDTLWVIERESGLNGRLLRPLSAKLLPPTIPEREGLVDRERLGAISGRSRKAQVELAKDLGVTDWPQPAGGCCFLTDETFGRRFHDLVGRRADRRLDQEEVPLLATGRHFRVSEGVKLIVGRTEIENFVLERFAPQRYRLEAKDVLGPLALVEGEPTPEERELASRIVARYGKGKDQPRVVVEWRYGADVRLDLAVEPFRDDSAFEQLRI
jgi:tRNA-uridine 2-sulfurtransferase